MNDYSEVGYQEDDKVELIQSSKSGNFIICAGCKASKSRLSMVIDELYKKMDEQK